MTGLSITRLCLRGLCFVGLLGAAACAPNPQSPTIHVPRAAQKVTNEARALLPDPNPPYQPASYAAKSLAGYYAGLQSRLLAQGKLKRNTAEGVNLTAEQLTQDFIDIALKDEYSRTAGGLVASATPTILRRWEKPVRIFTIFGATVPPEDRERQMQMVRNYTQTLRRTTGYDIQLTTRENANFYVLFMHDEDRIDFGASLERAVPELDPVTMNVFQKTPRNQLCVAITFRDQAGSPRLGKAIAMVRAEHPPLLQRSCVHEEMAQALGLPNDSDAARPSIFNDDEEYALLTRHDRLLLKILYDPRLKAGMNETQARPIVHKIARELLGQG